VPPAVETAFRGPERKEAEGFDPRERFSQIAYELLAGKDGDGKDFTVGGFGLWVVARVEAFEQVVEDAESGDDFVRHSSALWWVCGLYPWRGRT
jgi:hypothetical protein